MTTPHDVVVQFFKVFSTGDVDQILERLTQDATWWIAGTIPHMSGEKSKAELGPLLRHAVTLYRDNALRITPSSVIAQHDRVAVEAEGYAVLNDGRIYRNQYHFVVEVQGDHVHRVREYSDTHHMLATFSPYLNN